MRLLLIAPTCNGEDVGESWNAYQWTTLLAARHETTLLTYHKRDRRPAREQLSGIRVIEWQEPPLVGRAERLNSMVAPGYYVPFFLRARQWIRAALGRGERFDMVHQAVPVAMRFPCPAVGLGLPVVLGPVGGGLSSPPAFAAEETSDPWFVRLRRFDRMRLRYDPLLRRTYEGVDCVLGSGTYVQENLEGLRIRRFEAMPDVAVERVMPLIDRHNRAPGAVRILFVGRMVRSKGAREAIRAIGMCRDLNVTLDLVGDGPDRPACEALAQGLQLDDRVRFHGRAPRAAVDRFYDEADIFVFPSYREPGGTVVVEAMAHSLPVIVCDRGGPGATTTEACAIKLDAIAPDQLARDVAAALRRLVGDPALRLAMGRKAHEHLSRTGLWTHRVERVSELYEELIEARSPA